MPSSPPATGLGRSGSKSSRFGGMSPKTPIADSTLALQLQQFLDDYFFRVMASSLGKTWSRKKTLECALRLFQINGVQLTEEDIEWCQSHDDLMIPMIVRKMPFSIRENLESLCTQLNVLVHTATRVRTSVEGDSNDIDKIISEEDTGAIKEQILKESVIQASKEVAALMNCQDSWVNSTEKRLFRLSRSAELAESAQQQLLKVETQLDGLHEKASAKSKIAMMGFAGLSERNLLHSTFANWGGVATKYKTERQIRKKFEQYMLDQETMLIKLKERALVNVKSALHRKSQENAESMMFNFFNWWKEEVGSEQREAQEKEQLEKLEGNFKCFTQSKRDKAKQVMQRTADGNDEALACMAFSAWSKGVQTLKEENHVDAEAKKIEKQLADFKAKSQMKNAKVMERMSDSTTTSLLTTAVQGWSTYTKDAIKGRDLENTLMGAEGKFKMLNDRQKGTAHKVQTRVNDQMKQNLCIRVLAAWQVEAKINHVDKYYNAKMEGKRKQLQSVQTLFKSFAKQLEEGLGKLDDEDGDEKGDPSGRTSKPKGEGGSSPEKRSKKHGDSSHKTPSRERHADRGSSPPKQDSRDRHMDRGEESGSSPPKHNSRNRGLDRQPESLPNIHSRS